MHNNTAHFLSSIPNSGAVTQKETLFPLHFAEWPQSPGSANQIDQLTPISWSTRSEHLNVFWCNNKVWCRGVTKCPGSMIFPGPVLFALGWLICRWLSNRNAQCYCCTGFALMHSRIFSWFHTADVFVKERSLQAAISNLKKNKKNSGIKQLWNVHWHSKRPYSTHKLKTCWNIFLSGPEAAS